MNQILKIGIFAATFMLLTLGVHAQTPSPGSNPSYVEFGAAGTPESIDTVTVGSRMPYFVAPQTAVTGLTFEYKWVFGTTPPLSILNYAGSAATAGTGAGFYRENEISVVMPAAVSLIRVNTNVQSLAGTTVLCPAGADDEYSIQVVPRPTMAWKDAPPELIACAPVANDVTVDIQLTGYGQWEIDYQIVKSDLDGSNAATPITKTGVSVGAVKDDPGTAPRDFQLIVDKSDISDVGLYTITVTGITDRISRKSLDMTLVASQASDLPNAAFKVFVYPVPVTNPLQHVKNIH